MRNNTHLEVYLQARCGKCNSRGMLLHARKATRKLTGQTFSFRVFCMQTGPQRCVRATTPAFAQLSCKIALCIASIVSDVHSLDTLARPVTAGSVLAWPFVKTWSPARSSTDTLRAATAQGAAPQCVVDRTLHEAWQNTLRKIWADRILAILCMKILDQTCQRMPKATVGTRTRGVHLCSLTFL